MTNRPALIKPEGDLPGAAAHLLLRMAGEAPEDNNVQQLQQAIIRVLTDHYEEPAVFNQEKYCSN